MAGESLQVSFADLDRAAQSLAQVAESFNTAWQSFSAQVDSMGDIFGDDAVGGLIGGSYQAAHGIADETFTSAAEALMDFSDGLSRMAAAHERNERAARELFQQTSW